MSRVIPGEADISRIMTKLVQVAQRYGWECGKGISPRTDKAILATRKEVLAVVRDALAAARLGPDQWLKLHPERQTRQVRARILQEVAASVRGVSGERP